MNDIEKQLYVEHEERVRHEMYKYQVDEMNGENIYARFRWWCIATKRDETNDNDFAIFLKDDGITLTPLQKRMITEKHFGWVWNYEALTEKYTITRRKK